MRTMITAEGHEDRSLSKQALYLLAVLTALATAGREARASGSARKP
jgi:hypothetical protein